MVQSLGQEKTASTSSLQTNLGMVIDQVGKIVFTASQFAPHLALNF